MKAAAPAVDHPAECLPRSPPRLAVAAIARAGGQDGCSVTISVGVCDIARAGGDIDELYRLADAALYGAKAQGRNRCVLAD